jgi:hypothetical protein
MNLNQTFLFLDKAYPIGGLAREVSDEPDDPAGEPSPRRNEDMDNVIRELTLAVIKSRNVATLTRALKTTSTKIHPSNNSEVRHFGQPINRPSVRNVERTLSTESESVTVESFSRRSSASSNNRLRNSFRTLRSLSRGSKGVDVMRDLWKQTGMKTNGRKLLVDTLDKDDEVVDENERRRAKRRRRKRACRIHRRIHSDGVSSQSSSSQSLRSSSRYPTTFVYNDCSKKLDHFLKKV